MGTLEDWIYGGIVSLPHYASSEVNLALYYFGRGYPLSDRQRDIVSDAIAVIGLPPMLMIQKYNLYREQYVLYGRNEDLERMLQYVQL